MKFRIVGNTAETPRLFTSGNLETDPHGFNLGTVVTSRSFDGLPAGLGPDIWGLRFEAWGESTHHKRSYWVTLEDVKPLDAEARDFFEIARLSGLLPKNSVDSDGPMSDIRVEHGR